MLNASILKEVESESLRQAIVGFETNRIFQACLSAIKPA